MTSLRPGKGRRRIAMVAYTHYATDPRCRREAELCVEAGYEVDFFALRHAERTADFDAQA